MYLDKFKDEAISLTNDQMTNIIGGEYSGWSVACSNGRGFSTTCSEGNDALDCGLDMSLVRDVCGYGGYKATGINSEDME